MPGPPPKDPKARRRRNATPGFRQLPAEGRTGPAPDWPLSSPSDEELALWRKLWKLPQAVAWEEMSAEDTVALYVRTFVQATAPGSTDTKMLSEVRQLDAKIGLSPKAMRDMRWESGEQPQEKNGDQEPPRPEQGRAYVPRGS